MNIKVQVCGIIILLILLFFYKRQRRAFLNTERAFLYVIYAGILCLLLDIGSVITIHHMDALPDLYVKFVCKLYVVTLPTMTTASLIYLCSDIYAKSTEYRKMRCRYVALNVIFAILIFIAPIYIYSNEDASVVYTYGPSTTITYLSVGVCFVLLLYNMIKNRKRLNRKRRNSIMAWLILWIVAALIQLFNSELLVVGYGCAIGIMVIYLVLENPEGSLDRHTGIFSHNTFMLYMRQLYGQKSNFSLLALHLGYPSNMRIHAESTDEVDMEIISYLESIEGAWLFQNTSNEIILTFKNQELAEAAKETVTHRFSKYWGTHHDVMISATWVYVPNANIVDDPTDLTFLLHYASMNSSPEHDTFVVDEELLKIMELEQYMESIISDESAWDKVEVFYQPIYSIEAGRFTSAEALVRLRDEKGELIPPGRFISLAEQNGMILTLGKIVFEKVCQFIQAHPLEDLGMDYIEVNLSMVQCADYNLSKDYMQLMERYQVRPDQINLEITESATATSRKIIRANIQTLLDYGVAFSLDDFGTGESNLNYIVEMPVQIVKFDRYMTNSYFNSMKAKYIMDASIHMIQGMNLHIVSEGIETKEQFDTVVELGIDYVQGYYFSKPIPTEEFLDFIKEHNKN